MPTKAGAHSSGADGSRPDDPLLTLRFDVPRPPQHHVERRRLLRRLDEGADRPLTLVSAPAGSGKTTLLAAWVRQLGAEDVFGWLTFESGDDTPDAFWPLVAAALARGGVALPHDVSNESKRSHRQMLTVLSTALSEMRRPLTLVLDGLEVTDAGLGDDIVFVLHHSGGNLRLVILTRSDPVMALHRFRLEETVMEVRMRHLAFSEEETARLVEQVGVSLSQQSVTALVIRTRGWAAGLRFAAMLLAKSDHPDETVEQLTGDSGNVAEYLMAEVLQTQSEEARELLLRTSVVDVLQPGLIEALGGRSAGRRLAALAHANVLIEELSEHPGWFRYHPFLRDLLRAEFAYAAPRRNRWLQRRAASWFAEHGLVHEAVSLAVAAADWSDAAAYSIDGLAVGQLITEDHGGALGQVLRKMPAGTPGPPAFTVRAALALSDDDPDRCRTELTSARESAEAAARSAVSPSVDPTLALAFDVVETLLSRRVSDPEAGTVADRAASRLAAQRGDDATRAELDTLIQTSKGVAQLRAGDLASAHKTLCSAVDTAHGSGATALEVSAQAHLALTACLQGRLRQSLERGSRATALAEELALPPEERPEQTEVALGWVSTERCDLAAAGRHLAACSGSADADPILYGLRTVACARLLRSRGEVKELVSRIDGVRYTLPDQAAWLADLLAIEAAEARIAQGDHELAVRLLDGLHQPDHPASALVLGRAHLIRGDWDTVTSSVAAIASSDKVRTGLTVTVGGHLLAVACDLHSGQHRRARTALDRALRLAGPELLRRPFREAPRAVRAMLESDTELLDQNLWLGTAVVPRLAGRPHIPSSDAATPPRGELVEPLTAKEQEVLGHLSELLSTHEIAATMFVSVNTVRTHVRSILRKLAVTRRNEAVRRARALNLIAA